MIFYYPQDVKEENGPTAVVPGSQYYECRESWEEELAPVPLCGEAGTVALVHFDLWHQATPNLTDRTRYMMKFQFTRMAEPAAPSWNARDPKWASAGIGTGRAHGGVWSRIWDWHRGRVGGGGEGDAGAGSLDEAVAELRSGQVAERLVATQTLAGLGPAAATAVAPLAAALRDEAEPVRLNAAYALAAVGPPAVAALSEVLADDSEEGRLQAAYGLSCAGAAAAEETLIEAVTSSTESRRGLAAFALGEMGSAARREAAAALGSLASDESEWVRRNAAEALGTLSGQAEEAVPALVVLLGDADPQTRFNAAYSLAKHGPAAAPAVPALVQALEDDNRYVRSHSAEALKRIGTVGAQNALLQFLDTARWCPITNRDSAF